MANSDTEKGYFYFVVTEPECMVKYFVVFFIGDLHVYVGEY